MRIQFASDLHLECLRGRPAGETLVSPQPDADLLVLAGDIDNGVAGVRQFATWPVPVLYVPGNHEAYEGVLDAVRAAIREAARGTSVAVLDDDVADLSRFGAWSVRHRDELRRLRFVGSTLWTDYRLPSAGGDPIAGMQEAAGRIVDHRLIRKSEGTRFMPEDALALHERSRHWLEGELGRPFDGKTIVVTHHAPHEGSIHQRYAGQALNAAFASHLPELLAQADLWVHGHTHDSFDYAVGRCRVVANPRGYPRNVGPATTPGGLAFENRSFRRGWVIEV